MSIRRFRASIVVVTVCSTCIGCLSDEERQTINDWLTCEECSAGERQAAVAVGWKAVPRLGGALEEGPSSQRLANMERKITANWRRLSAPRLSLQETLDLYLGNYTAVYHARAALALGDIARASGRGADRARSELRSAQQRDSTERANGRPPLYRDDVLEAIGGALAGTLNVNAGQGQEALPGTAVTVVPTVLVLDAEGAPVRGAPVFFKVESGGGSVGSPDQLTDVSGRAAAGSWSLGPTLGANILTATTPDLPSLTFTASAVPPTITSLDPGSGPVGTRVRVDGSLLAHPLGTTTVTLNGSDVNLFVVNGDRDSLVVLMPLAGPAGAHTLIVAVDGTASAAATWQQIGMQEADDPDNNDATTAPTVAFPLDAVGTFNGGDTDDIYNFMLATDATLVIDLDWDERMQDLDLWVMENPPSAEACVDGATTNKPEQSVCTLPAGSYSIWIEDFSASMESTTPNSYRLRAREQ